jgi:hypothetical protein
MIASLAEGQSLSPERLTHGLGYLADVRLQEIDFRRNDEFDFERPLNYKVVTSSEVELAEDLTNGTVLHAARVEWVEEDGSSESRPGPFELALTLGAYFVLHASTPDHDELAAWIEVNTDHLLWPYLRAQIAGITTNAGLPPLTIYTISVPTMERAPGDIFHETPESSESVSAPEVHG